LDLSLLLNYSTDLESVRNGRASIKKKKKKKEEEQSKLCRRAPFCEFTRCQPTVIRTKKKIKEGMGRKIKETTIHRTKEEK